MLWTYQTTDISLKSQAEQLAARSPYGWGHTIDFGPFVINGLLGDNFMTIASLLDAWSWWPGDLNGLQVADVGCFTGGLSLILASRGANVYAIDEVPEHLAQCGFLLDAFGVKNVQPIEASLYRLQDHIKPASLDVVLLSGVLYHLSDMLTGLLTLHNLLKPSGLLLIESYANQCIEHSYANFLRFVGGGWWEPSALCISDMCEYMGYDKPEIRFYEEKRCLVRARKTLKAIPFKRGLNYPFTDIHDEKPRTLDLSILRPAPCHHE